MYFGIIAEVVISRVQRSPTISEEMGLEHLAEVFKKGIRMWGFRVGRVK